MEKTMQPKVLREELCVAIGKLVVAPKPGIGSGTWNAIEPVVMISRGCLKATPPNAGLAMACSKQNLTSKNMTYQ